MDPPAGAVLIDTSHSPPYTLVILQYRGTQSDFRCRLRPSRRLYRYPHPFLYKCLAHPDWIGLV